MILADPPLTPGPEEAREWLERELAKPIYHEGPSLWEQIKDWVRGVLADIMQAGGSLGPVLTPLLLLMLLLGLAAIVMWIGRPIRRRRRRSAAGAAVLSATDRRTAEQLRAAAEAAAAAGDHSLAVLERFRAIARGLDERAIGTDAVGATAHEVAVAGAGRLPQCRADLDDAARRFDRVAYGAARAGAADYAAVVAADERVQAATPEPVRSGA